MMRALSILVVACAVAAGAAGGTGHGEVRTGARATLRAREVPAALGTAAVRPVLHAVAVRAGRVRGARASHGSLPAVAVAAGGSIEPPRRTMAAPALPAGGRRAERPIRTGSARGPPIG